MAYGVLLSTYLVNLVSLVKNSISQRNIWNNKQPSVDPWGTPKSISSKELKLEFILVLCFLNSYA